MVLQQLVKSLQCHSSRVIIMGYQQQQSCNQTVTEESPTSNYFDPKGHKCTPFGFILVSLETKTNNKKINWTFCMQSHITAFYIRCDKRNTRLQAVSFLFFSVFSYIFHALFQASLGALTNRGLSKKARDNSRKKHISRIT